MAATYTKPIKKPRWGTTTTHITEPSEGKKDLGWVFAEIPPSDIENWRTHTVETWLDWIDERIFDGASADELLLKSPGNASDALKITDTEITTHKSFIPNSDNTIDLGSSGVEFKDLYIDGVANIDTMVLSTVGGEGVGSHWIPTTDDTYDLGSLSYKWKDLYVDGIARIDTLILSTLGGEGLASDMIPSVDSTYQIGSTTYRFSLGYFDLGIFTNGLNSPELATSSNMDVNLGAGSAFRPKADLYRNLGDATHRWETLHSYSATIHGPYPIILPDDTTPSNPDSTRTKGTIVWDASYLYVKTANTNGWKRISLTAF